MLPADVCWAFILDYNVWWFMLVQFLSGAAAVDEQIVMIQ